MALENTLRTQLRQYQDICGAKPACHREYTDFSTVYCKECGYDSHTYKANNRTFNCNNCNNTFSVPNKVKENFINAWRDFNDDNCA